MLHGHIYRYTYIKTEVIYVDIAKVDRASNKPQIYTSILLFIPLFDTSNYEIDRQLPRRKNKEVFGLMKDELGTKLMSFLR